MKDVDPDPDPGVKKLRKLCSKFYYILLIYMQLPNFILLIISIYLYQYWYQCIFDWYPNLFENN